MILIKGVALDFLIEAVEVALRAYNVSFISVAFFTKQFQAAKGKLPIKIANIPKSAASQFYR